MQTMGERLLHTTWNHHHYRVQISQCHVSFCNNSPTSEHPSVRFESRAVRCWNVPIKRSDLGLIFINKQTTGKPKTTSYSRRRQIWLSAGCTRN